VDRTVTVKQELISDHEPQMGLDTKTDWLTISHSVTLTWFNIEQHRVESSFETPAGQDMSLGAEELNLVELRSWQ
jgi:hypothetical protein